MLKQLAATSLAFVLLVIADLAFCSNMLGQEFAPDEINLDRIMADPEWLGHAPEEPFWSDDGKTVFYRRERVGSDLTSWFQIDLAGNLIKVFNQPVPPTLAAENGDNDRQGRRRVYVRDGDLFLKNLDGKSAPKQLTRSRATESAPQFLSDGKRISFVRDKKVYVRNLRTGLELLFVEALTTEDPIDLASKKREGYLPEQQSRLFDTIREKQRLKDEASKEDAKSRRDDKTRAPLPWYLATGNSDTMAESSLSPSGKLCLVVVSPSKSDRGKQDRMPEFVHESGYVNVRDVRPLVGTGTYKSDRLFALDLVAQTSRELLFESLPMISDDPLAPLKNVANAEDGAGAAAPADRPIRVGEIDWSDDGRFASVSVYSHDNKDRWITVFNSTPSESQLKTVMHHRDPAWINWRVGAVNWLRDRHALYYSSESTGYAQLYLHDADAGATKSLTSGEFVVRNVEQGAKGKTLYYQANKTSSRVYEMYRVDTASGETTQLTRLGGMNIGLPSPDESQLLVSHSSAMSPPELWLVPIDPTEESGGGEPRQLTQTISVPFQQINWVKPQFVEIPSRIGRPIHARLYLPPKGKADAKRARNGAKQGQPAVIFIHGAGYLQNAHEGWSPYFREFMFHSLLARQGYVVLDMDYRGSAGYGRDWRTAIYRQMGTPEVEDLLDGKAWLINEHKVTDDRVGLYGGSYGGFLTMMALFKHPGEFACGAALRPVTDWAHYNHGYTSNILNTPSTDPEAYRRSSPIEFAAGLADPLLMCHGMVDDNVFFKDTARLAQRLIELKKENWEVAIYPIEPHGFRQPSSWRDEYRRILKLFNENLQE
jgi:dipeptidyl aminopeptidase/acylaminoacyl peptidase